jgi:hypothetical protein
VLLALRGEMSYSTRALQYHAGTVHEVEADRGPAADCYVLLGLRGESYVVAVGIGRIEEKESGGATVPTVL